MATAKNDVTGDWLQSKPNSEQFEKNWDLIFGKKKKEVLPEHELNKSTGEVQKVDNSNTTEYEIIDNFLDDETFKLIKNNLESADFSWNYSSNVVLDKEGETYYFKHLIFLDGTSRSFYYDLMKPILNKLDYKILIRIKANLYTNMGKYIEDEKHIDYDFDHKGAIYFINNNNAPTILEDGTKIEAIENRLLKFNSRTWHNSSHPTDVKARFTINFNYI